MLVYPPFWVCAHEGFNVFATLQVGKIIELLLLFKTSFFLNKRFLCICVTVIYKEFKNNFIILVFLKFDSEINVQPIQFKFSQTFSAC